VILKEIGNRPVAVFAIWQPMLPTDWTSPTGSVLARMPDVRVRQYWDPNHLIAKRMGADARPPQPEPDCCEQEGILWDLAAVYPQDATWADRMPSATLVNGPVVAVAEDIATAVKTMLSGQ
jgi:hypothetical protein